MANKYIRHGETYCGDGTSPDAATSNGGVGAWNNINVFEGTAPAYGALVAGDTVYIRSKDAAGADMVFTKSSGAITYLGQAAATANNPTSWILDDGTVWPGINGILKYHNSINTNRVSFRANNFFKSSQNNLRYATTQTSGSASDGQHWMEVHGVVDGLHFDTTTYTNTGPTHQILFGDGGTLINPVIKLGALSSWTDTSRQYCFFGAGTSRADIFLVNPDIELTYSNVIGQGFFSLASLTGKNSYVFGGRMYGVGTNVAGQLLIGVSPSGSTSGMVKLVGFQFPRSMKVTDNRILPTQANSTGGSFIEIIGCDNGLGGHHEACWGWMTSRTDNNPPYLSALSLDSASTPWAWRVYPGYANMQSPMQIPTTKMYTGAAGVKTVSLEVLIADTMLAAGSEIATKSSLWMAVAYTDSSGIPRSENTRGFGNLDASTAPWSATVWGMISLVKKKLSVTTQYRVLPGQTYAENIAAPFGSFAGGKWFVAQGWWLTGVQAADSKNYQLVSHTGVTETPPTSVAIQVGGVVSGDYVLVARDNGSGGFANDTTLASSATAGATSVTLTAAPADTPVAPGSQTCYIRINGNRHTYTGRSGNTISGLSPAVPVGGYASGLPVFIPFIDAVSAGTSIQSANFQYSAPFTARYRVRNGGGSPIVPFESTLAVTSNGGSGTAVRGSDA